jgi:hypothetical protein
MPNAEETNLAIVLLPAPAGPSIAIAMFLSKLHTPFFTGLEFKV